MSDYNQPPPGTPIARLLTDGSDLMANVNMLLHNANSLFSEENVSRVSNFQPLAC